MIKYHAVLIRSCYPDYTTRCHCSPLICSRGNYHMPSGDSLDFPHLTQSMKSFWNPTQPLDAQSTSRCQTQCVV